MGPRQTSWAKSWALPKTCNFMSWALSWAQGTNSDKLMSTTFLLGLVPKTNVIPFQRSDNLNYSETWTVPVDTCCLIADIYVECNASD